MVEVAEELVEAMGRRQEAVLVAQMVLAELPSRITQRFQRLGNGDIAVLDADGCARYANLGHAGPEHRLTCDEGRASGGAAVLRIIIGEHHAFIGEAVDVRRPVAHHAERIGADVRLTDIVAEDNQNVGFRGVLREGRAGRHGNRRGQHRSGKRQRFRLQRPGRGSGQQATRPLQIDSHNMSPLRPPWFAGTGKRSFSIGPGNVRANACDDKYVTVTKTVRGVLNPAMAGDLRVGRNPG